MLPLFYKQDADIRKHQINTLKIFNDNVLEVVADSEYEIPFQCGSNKLTIKISLGHEFPKEKPVLAITPIIFHPWVNENGMIIAAPGLVNFTVHSDLGRVVQAIIREFQRNPPPLAANNNVISPNIPILDGEKRVSGNAHSSYSFSPPSYLMGYIPVKTSNSPFTDLKSLSVDELIFLNENEDRLMEFLDEHPYIKSQQKIFDDVITQTEELAEDNLSKEKHLELLKEAVDSRIEDVSKLSFNNERLYTVYQDLSQKYSPRNILEELRKSAKKAEEDTDKTVDSFLQGSLDVDNFLNIFIKTKALCQLRKTKEEKLCQQLDHLEKAGF